MSEDTAKLDELYELLEGMYGCNPSDEELWRWLYDNHWSVGQAYKYVMGINNLLSDGQRDSNPEQVCF